MRLLINGLAARSGGAQTYLLNIIPILAEKYAVELWLLVYKDYAQSFQIPGVQVISPNHKPSNILARVVWEKFSLPKLLGKEKVDIYYAPGGMLGCAPPKSTKSVVAFRNMLPFSPKEMARFNWGYNKIRYFLLRKGQSKSFRTADLTVFISNFAKEVIDGYVPTRLGKSVVIAHGIDEVFRSKNPPLPDSRLDAGKYFLYVSPIKPYKAQLEVVESWGAFRDGRSDNSKLIFAGGLDAEYSELVKQRISRLALEECVVLLGSIPHKKLPGLYQHSRAIIFASSCENCPNVLIESLNSGRPVLCSDIQPMPEFGGDAVRYFDPYQPNQLAGLLSELADDEAAIAELAAKALNRGKFFSWEKSVDQLMAAFHDLTRA